MAKSALAAGLSWWVTERVTDVSNPVLSTLTAVVVVQVSVRASMKSALQRTAAVLAGVLAAVAIGDALSLDGLTVALIVGLALAVAQLLVRLPAAAARQVPITMLVVLSVVAPAQATTGWQRAMGTVIGAAVGITVSLVLPASRLVDARQTLDRLSIGLGRVLEEMGAGLHSPWTSEQTENWRRQARVARERLVDQAVEAVGHSKEAARWNFRDRRHIAVLERCEEVLSRLERTAIGVSVIARGLDDHARLSGAHRAMPGMGGLLVALGDAIRALVNGILARPGGATLSDALVDVRDCRARCVRGASRRARIALDHDDETTSMEREGEWLNYAAILVQVDRIVADLEAPLPS